MSYNYRVFVDIYGKTHFYRKQTSSSTTLTASISATDIIIPVFEIFPLFDNDLAKLNSFNNNPTTPQTVWIGNERIEFFTVDLTINDSKLIQCIRGTAGTSAVPHSNGDTVWDGSERQSLLAEANKIGSSFAVADVNRFPWNANIINFLSEA